MRTLIRTNDPVVLSFAEAVLDEGGIDAVVLDRNISALEGSIGAFPRRMAVREDMWYRACRLMTEAGLGEWIVDEGEE